MLYEVVETDEAIELEYGATKSKWGSRTREALHMFLASFEILPFSDVDAVFCGLIRAERAVRGIPIGTYDVMIFAKCLAYSTDSNCPDIFIWDFTPRSALSEVVCGGKGDETQIVNLISCGLDKPLF